MNEPLPVSREAAVDPCGTFTSFAKAETRLRQLTDPAASKKENLSFIFLLLLFHHPFCPHLLIIFTRL